GAIPIVTNSTGLNSQRGRTLTAREAVAGHLVDPGTVRAAYVGFDRERAEAGFRRTLLCLRRLGHRRLRPEHRLPALVGIAVNLAGNPWPDACGARRRRELGARIPGIPGDGAAGNGSCAAHGSAKSQCHPTIRPEPHPQSLPRRFAAPPEPPTLKDEL